MTEKFVSKKHPVKSPPAGASQDFVPNQVDFAILTINETEDKAVHEVFGFRKKNGILSDKRLLVGHRGKFHWGIVKTKFGDDVVVVHASTCDRKGPLPAIELIRELDQRFRPQFLLVIGTAGGIKSRKLGYGQVVFSRQVHVGYQNLADSEGEMIAEASHGRRHFSAREIKITLHDDPVQPPLDRLHSHAQRVADEWQMVGRYPYAEHSLLRATAQAIEEIENIPGLEKESTSTPRRSLARKKSTAVSASETAQWKADIISSLSAVNHPRSTEFFSGPYLIDGHNSELYRTILATFPKVGAIEMEAGAVAQAVLYSVETERYIGYLVIKGISDIVDSPVPRECRKDVRKAVGFLAAFASARFALDLIYGWDGASSQPVGKLSLVPAKYCTALEGALKSKKWSNSEIYTQVTIDRYSYFLKTLCKTTGVKSVWTLCYLAPVRFFAELYTDVDQLNELKRSEIVCKENSNASLAARLKQTFPHFQIFIDLAKSGNTQVSRIVHAGKDWDNRNRHCLKAFGSMNGAGAGKISCHILRDSDFDGEEQWARNDQVVINDELLLDYDMASQRLVVTYLDKDGLQKSFIRFRQHCEARAKHENEYEVYSRKILKNMIGRKH